jgi:serine/threonine-protein kinase
MSVEVDQEIGDRYYVEAFVGKGGMAEVYRVYDRQRAVRLAMKLLQADLAEDLVFLRRFRRKRKR